MTRAGPDAPQVLLRRLFDAAVAAADPMRVVAPAVPPSPPERLTVIGAGKASARMAEALEAALGPCDGLVVTRYGYGRPTAGIEIIEAAHPEPDAAGYAATQRILKRVSALGAEHHVLALISGGASALLTAPIEGVSLAEKQALNRALLASGMPIGRINIVRKHVSAVKGGRLGAACFPARLTSLLISDVPGDDPAEIGSGPTVGEASTPEVARALLDQYGVERSASIDAALRRSSSVAAPDDPRLARAEVKIIAAPIQSLHAAAAAARAVGCTVEVLGDAIEGEAREVARDHAQLALLRRAALDGGAAPHLILSGGELTVTRRGDGVGGPNAEYALALAHALDGAPGVYALAGDTDGVDGAAEVAGAHIAPDTLSRAGGGAVAETALATNDSHSFFAALGDQLITGPTLTNVNDFRVILVTR